MINHHSMQVVFVTATVGGGHVAGNVAVLQSDGVLAFNDQTLGVVGCEGGIFYCDIRSAVNSRAAHAAGGIRAAIHVDGAAAPVTADSRGGIPLRVHGQVAGNGRAAAGGLDAAGVALCGVDGGIRDGHCGALSIAEHPVAVDGGGIHRGACDRHIGTVQCQKTGILSVEIAVLRVGGIAAGLFDGHIVEGGRHSVCPQGIFIITGGGVRFTGDRSIVLQGSSGGAVGHLTAAAESPAGLQVFHGNGNSLVVVIQFHLNDLILGQIIQSAFLRTLLEFYGDGRVVCHRKGHGLVAGLKGRAARHLSARAAVAIGRSLPIGSAVAIGSAAVVGGATVCVVTVGLCRSLTGRGAAIRGAAVCIVTIGLCSSLAGRSLAAGSLIAVRGTVAVIRFRGSLTGGSLAAGSPIAARGTVVIIRFRGSLTGRSLAARSPIAVRRTVAVIRFCGSFPGRSFAIGSIIAIGRLGSG